MNIKYIAVLFVLASSFCYAQELPKRRAVPKISLVWFVLDDGRAVSGRVESEDSRQIRVAQISDAAIISQTYNKDQIDRKTISYKSISELDYWRDSGEYFLSRTWDFQNDPDEFAQAARCFQRAKELVIEAMGEGNQLADELEKRIQKIGTDTEKWSLQAEQRSKMRNLETLAELDGKLGEIQKRLDENAKAISELKQELKSLSSASAGQQQLQEKLNDIDVSTRFLQQRLGRLESDMDSLWRWNRSYNRYYYTPKNRTDSNSP